ncbi:hypothetical protein AK830_g11930 [Neonectria ditissima]|uniref:Uncharacterized protein n=1 Tax=Neonectria ditissima TaxID=78410 RepID=A0A0N8H4Y2_9HYPO|nr:hypothetical protein AK830_g11930 [Neonectria ditissima]
MAKIAPEHSLEDMVKDLGPEVDPSAHPCSPSGFYLDLGPVSASLYERTRREFDALQMAKKFRQCSTLSRPHAFSRSDSTKIEPISGVEIRENGITGYFRFSVDVHYGTNQKLSLPMTQDDICQILSIPRGAKVPSAHSLNYLWNDERLLKGIGDPTGFYFPIAKGLGFLSANKLLRHEALPMAYRCTAFRFEDMDDLVKCLLAIGRLGRGNVEALDFPWESGSDSKQKWELFPQCEDNHLKLPSLHVDQCVDLLQQCTRLKYLRIQFSQEVLSSISKCTFETDPGIRRLCSLRRIPNVKIYSLISEVANNGLAEWLKDQIEHSNELRATQST